MTVCPPKAQIRSPKLRFSLKGIRTPLEMGDSREREKKCQMFLETLVEENEGALQEGRGALGGHRSYLEGAPAGQTWDILNIEINNNNKLKLFNKVGHCESLLR